MFNSSPDLDGRRARKALQTAEHLVKTAFGLFEEHGYDQVSMEQIASTADVAKGTLYKHFPVKEALIQHRFQADLARVEPDLRALLAMDLGCEPTLRLLFDHHADHAERTKPYLLRYLLYRMGQAPGAKRSGLDQIFRQILEQGQVRGNIVAEQTAERLSSYLEVLMLGAVLRWLHSPGANLKQDYGQMLDVFLNGARARGVTA